MLFQNTHEVPELFFNSYFFGYVKITVESAISGHGPAL
jgi:hypothetical protein